MSYDLQSRKALRRNLKRLERRIGYIDSIGLKYLSGTIGVTIPNGSGSALFRMDSYRQLVSLSEPLKRSYCRKEDLYVKAFIG